MKYEVGGYLEGYAKNYPEGVRFDITDEGASIITYFQRPSSSEINQFKTGKIKLGYYTYKNVIMLLIKIGDLEWMDAPYSSHLSKNLTEIQEVKEGQGLATTIALVDALSGEIKTLRLVGANHRLTKGLLKAVGEQKKMSFDNYDENITYLFRTYSIKELVKRANMVENLAIRK